ncbi:5'/3'-nucleotidase SurE [Amycolatopsis magusensis]|uniref:5'-nucleotidase n=1 Tax=Amycolatopsis magusensis TaxID=882444 RepID=A0ABS4Q056_9PSEU|nr:5'/3'-nucleotidase SurE [Amycolatopsis magusensis]MBP2185056.1 5'-nucleotidase [Amycolatopsis magusensis]MDI5980772.1 5'/3'-nucleotidase SurE [Amycolatopsis magusensis]
MTRVLITNDDGIDSPGLVTLARAALRHQLDVVVAAPHEESSGTSAGLTVLGTESVAKPVELAELPGVLCHAVTARPAYIVLAAREGSFGDPPDLVLSGVNRGVNIGRAVLHSGTVGAALTAGMNDLRALAVSLEHPESGLLHWDSAEDLAAEVIPMLLEAAPGTVLNLNVPARPRAELGPLTRAGLSSAGAVQTRLEQADESAEVVTTVVEGGAEPGTDAYLLQKGTPTITALRSVTEDPDFTWPPGL